MNTSSSIKYIYENTGKKIKFFREIKRMTLNELSDKTGIRTEYLKKIEKGTAKGLLISKHLLKIANALDVKMVDIFDFTDENK